MKRTTIFLSDELHERLRNDAFRAKVSMAELIRRTLQGPGGRARGRKGKEDPILKVAGVHRGPSFANEIDEPLYGG